MPLRELIVIIRNYVNVPTLITSFRLVIAPLLLYLAWIGEHTLFLVFLGCSLLSDLTDGFVARKLNQASEFGAKLDSWSDFVTNITILVCAWWLWPNPIRREAPFIITIIAVSTVPLTFGFFKYGRLISYHAWSTKLSTVLIIGTALILILGGSPWPFRLSTFVLVIAQMELTAMTAILPEWQPNVPSLWHAIELSRCLKQGKKTYKAI
ncbi:MAG: CDP-alcohol phosphatidyltransferase [Candidatus Dadabacteria bacterium]